MATETDTSDEISYRQIKRRQRWAALGTMVSGTFLCLGLFATLTGSVLGGVVFMVALVGLAFAGSLLHVTRQQEYAMIDSLADSD